MINQEILKRILAVVSVCALTVSTCILLYSYDNKYTVPGPFGRNGILTLGKTDIRGYTVLAHGWAVYGGMLLTPEDFQTGAAPQPDMYISIGQLGGFERLTGSPHGSATYRLTIGIPEERRSYTLAIPEIFSSCRVYINGREMLALGETDPENFRFETGNAAITFDAAGEIDILIAASDFGHLYSGMFHPPVIGEPDAVSHMLYTRFILRNTVLAAAVIIGAMALTIGLFSKRKGLAVLYGLLCLSFAVYICHPIAMTLFRGTTLFYAAERFAFCAMLLVVIALQKKLFHTTGRTEKLHRYIFGFGALCCLAALVIPLLLPLGNLSLMMGYSRLITIYLWITAGYITIKATIAVWGKDAAPTPLFYGMLILNSTLIMDRVLNDFEPILSGWFTELGSLALVLSVGVAVAREIIRRYHESTIFDERVQAIISTGRDYYEKLTALSEKLHIQNHDYKYHLAVLQKLLAAGDTQSARDYLENLTGKASGHQIKEYCKSRVINALLNSFEERCINERIVFTANIALPDSITIDDYELCILFGNLLENAFAACLALECGRYIELRARLQGHSFGITVINSFNGEILIKDGEIVSKKAKGGTGIKSIQSIVSRHGGDFVHEWDESSFRVYAVVNVA